MKSTAAMEAATSQTTVAPAATATTAASETPSGPHVSVMGLWSGPELESFMKVKAAWEKETGGTVDWVGTQDIANTLNTRIQAGKAPDIAILPNPGLVQQLAKDGKLVPLDSFMDMSQVKQDYAPAWIDLGSYGGNLYAIFYKVANKATIWYSPKAFAAGNYTVPKTWDELIALADKIVADGHTPFSIVAPSGPGSGWALTDWISEIVLNNCGADLYNKWIAGKVPWTDVCIKQSFELFNKIIQTKGYVLGGSQGILSTGDDSGADPLYSNPPEAYMYYLASFAQGFIASKFPQLNAGEYYNFFIFPVIKPENAGTVTIGADIPVMVNDTPAARSFMNYLASARAQEVWVKLGGFTSVNQSVSPDAYPDDVAREVAKALTEAKIIRFGAGDMMPAALQREWWKDMVELVKDPSLLDEILSSLTEIAKNAK